MKPSLSLLPKILVPALILAGLGISGWYIDAARARERSTLSGFFETQPTAVASRATGRIALVEVREGDAVRTGDPLLRIEAAPTAAEVASQRAAAEQARARLSETVNGPRPEDIRKQEAVVAEAEAAFRKLVAGPRPEEIGAARARVRAAAAQYERVRAGARPEEIAQARAAEAAARARLAEAEHGPTAEERAQAKARLDAATARADLARADAERYARLYVQQAVTRQQRDQTEAQRQQTAAEQTEAEQALRRAEEGTRPEQIAQARESYRQAHAALELVRAGSRREDKEAVAAQLSEAQQNLLVLENGSRPEDIRAARARLAQVQAELSELRTGSRREEIAQARAAAESAAATAHGSALRLAEQVVRAPRDGTIERIPVAVGDLVSSGTTLVRLAVPDDLWIRVYVPEASLARVRVGQPAALRIDGIPDAIAAHVESVSERGEFTPANLQTPEERGRQVFAVRLRPDRPDTRLKAGMYATVTRIGDWEP